MNKGKIVIIVIFLGLVILYISSLYQLSLPDSVIFTKIYKENKWEKGSGPGSYEKNTIIYRKLLQNYFDDQRFQTIIDFGCGDFQIMKLINVPVDKIYKGIDVVPEVIQQDKKHYAKANIKFYLIKDLYEINPQDQILQGDLLIIKDVLMHWSNKKIQYFIDQILPNYKYALITHDIAEDAKLNKNINTGNFRPIDITHPPFNLKNAKMVLEYEGGGRKRVYFYTNPNLVK
jgi:hypothetical protein